MGDEDKTKEFSGSGALLPGSGVAQGPVSGGQTPPHGSGTQYVDPSIAMNIQLQAALLAMTNSFNTMTDQAKQNNKTFLNDLPFFGIVKEPGEKRNIVPMTECVKFIALIDTATDKNEFTEAGKISVLKSRLLGSAKEFWNSYDGAEDWRAACNFLKARYPEVTDY